MKEIKQETKKGLFETINATRTANGLNALEENTTRTIGNNGMQPGERKKLTGKLNPCVEVKNQSGKTTATYIGLECSDGTFISLASFMGLSSLKGYSTTEKAINTVREKPLASSPAIETEVTPEVAEGFDFDAMFKPDFRDLYDEAAYLLENPEIIADKTAVYWGTVVRQIVAKKDSPATSFEHYIKGDKRAMSAKMWELTD